MLAAKDRAYREALFHRVIGLVNDRELEGFHALQADDVVWRTSPGWPERETVVGKAAVRAWVAGFFSIFESVQVITGELEHHGMTVLAPARWHNMGAASGATTDLPFAIALTFREGLVVEGAFFDDCEQARARLTGGG